MFNEEWRDELLAFISALQKDGRIGLDLSSTFTMSMPLFPQSFWADFGYFDPKDKSRQEMLTNQQYEEETEDE